MGIGRKTNIFLILDIVNGPKLDLNWTLTCPLTEFHNLVRLLLSLIRIISDVIVSCRVGTFLPVMSYLFNSYLICAAVFNSEVTKT